jgi:hypothetical protein
MRAALQTSGAKLRSFPRLDTIVNIWLICVAFRARPGPRKGLSLPAGVGKQHNLDAACQRTTGDSRKVKC